ncbi:unnamed protein product (macronuclear) [Paramecium tetraurelia]|uniref:Uncharacterized protein n=1 Tax=Paramecium tetraurelia TaxID=5888 RepID=A0E690_PARTE|nr:uncharacterized protein GSPATT00003672001 [Paramecium tetraurelia]CAK90807.1 unnamed protein product [Paramecium tetraurelia]|eukprot:XP_001458204.1 hypothetical protein (macronuclear) [Paramecium tetraurelia strain d4-2]
MKNYLIGIDDGDSQCANEQCYWKTQYIDPAYEFSSQKKQLKQHLKATQQNNRFELVENGQQILRRKIKKNGKMKKSVPEVNLHLKGLLEQFINESIQQANKGFIFRQLQNCQEIKSTIDKMERFLIRMKSLLLSQMISCQQ